MILERQIARVAVAVVAAFFLVGLSTSVASADGGLPEVRCDVPNPEAVVGGVLGNGGSVVGCRAGPCEPQGDAAGLDCLSPNLNDTGRDAACLAQDTIDRSPAPRPHIPALTQIMNEIPSTSGIPYFR
jgi:hypothetical protein